MLQAITTSNNVEKIISRKFNLSPFGFAPSWQKALQHQLLKSTLVSAGEMTHYYSGDVSKWLVF